MFKYFTAKGTRKWIDVIQQIIDTYNSTHHRSIKMAPNQVNPSNEQNVFKNLYKVNNPKELYSKIKTQPKLQTNTDVRIPYKQNVFDKSYYPLWSDKTYKIKKGYKKERPVYKINNTEGQKYEQEVQRIIPFIYRIENIVKKRVKDNKTEYLIKWIGYDSSFNSWEPEGNIINL